MGVGWGATVPGTLPGVGYVRPIRRPQQVGGNEVVDFFSCVLIRSSVTSLLFYPQLYAEKQYLHQCMYACFS